MNEREGGGISLWENWDPLKKREEKVKIGRGNSTANTNKKSTKTVENDKTKERCWNMWEIERKRQQWKKITLQLAEINQKVLTKEGRLKRYRHKVKQHRQNRTFQNNERKFCQQLGGDDTKTYQQPDGKETERFWTKIWHPKT